MTKKYRFTDQMNFQVLDVDQDSLGQIRDDYPGAFKPQGNGQPHPTGLGTMPGSETVNAAPASGRGLVIKVAATHAGLVTRNNGLYLPDKMRTGAGTWTEHYQKPIQVHHEDHKDPVGRVLSARYVETVGAVIDRFQNHVLRDSFGKQVGVANSQFWRDFSADGSFHGKLEQIKLMDSILNDPHYSGVGYIELTADITDPVAIQKVMDGRFLTGSVGAVSDKAVCSVCSTNWLDEEHCGHKPGRLYDGKKCFVVAGNLEYDEWSFVNTPADRHSLVLETAQNGINDSKVEDSASRVLYFIPTDLSNKEGAHMKDAATEVESDKADIEDAAAATEIVEDSVEVADDTKTETEEVATEETVTEIKDDVQPSTVLAGLWDKLFVDSGSAFVDADEEVLYNLMMSTLVEADGFSVEDVKLDVEARKKLPSSAFCGPKRTFPVTDEAHYIAAKRLATQLSAMTDNTEAADFTSKIERKGKALGFATSIQQDAVEPVEPVEEKELKVALVHKYEGELDDATKVEVAAAFVKQLVEQLGETVLASALVDSDLAVSKDTLNLQVEETLKQEDAVGELRDQLSLLRRELSATYDDVAQLEDRLIEKASETRDAKVARLKDLHILDNSLNEDVETTLSTISDEALNSSLTTLLAKVDTVKIADKLNDGLSRIPDETVSNPAAVTEPSSAAKTKDNVSQETTEAKPSFKNQRMVDETYHHLFVKQQNPFKAKKYYTDMVAAGFAVSDPERMLAHDSKEE